MRTSPILEKYVAAYRKTVTFADIDRVFSDDMHRTVAFWQEVGLDF
jgi:histidine ammonia-lyase